MHAVPPITSGKEVDPSGAYGCPLCKVQGSGDAADTGWVACPMVRGGMICLGCCVDHQSVARAVDFYDHPYVDLFEMLARDGVTTVQLRRACLQHQAEIVDEELRVTDEHADALATLRATIARALHLLENP